MTDRQWRIVCRFMYWVIYLLNQQWGNLNDQKASRRSWKLQDDLLDELKEDNET